MKIAPETEFSKIDSSDVSKQKAIRLTEIYTKNSNYWRDKRDRFRHKLRYNPKWRTKREIMVLLNYFGFTLDHITGSHHVFRRDEEETMYSIVIPLHGQQVKPIYVKQVLERIDELFPIDETVDEENDDE